jgi:hypothetical protein
MNSAIDASYLDPVRSLRPESALVLRWRREVGIAEYLDHGASFL